VPILTNVTINVTRPAAQGRRARLDSREFLRAQILHLKWASTSASSPKPRHNIPFLFHRYAKAGHGFQNPARNEGRNTDEIAASEVRTIMNKSRAHLGGREK
jgi:hypothetical protein